MSMSIFTGIDVGSKYIKVVICTKNKGVRLISSTIAPSAGVSQGKVEDSEALGLQIKKILKNIQVEKQIPEIKNAYMSIDPHLISTEEIKISHNVTSIDNTISENDIEVIQNKAQRSFHKENYVEIISYPIKYILDEGQVYKNINGLVSKNIEAHYLFISMTKNVVDGLNRAAEKAEIDLLGISSSSFFGSLKYVSKIDRQSGSVVIGFGHGITTVCVYQDDYIIFMKNYEIGLEEVTKMVATELKVDLTEAESMKKNIKQSIQRRKMEQIYKTFLKKVSLKIKADLKKEGLLKNLPGGAIVVSPFNNNEVLLDFIRSNLDLIVKKPAENNISESGISFTPAYCLTLNYLNKEDVKKTISKNIQSFFSGFLKKISI